MSRKYREKRYIRPLDPEDIQAQRNLRRYLSRAEIVTWSGCLYHGSEVEGLREMLSNGIRPEGHHLCDGRTGESLLLSTSTDQECLVWFSDGEGYTGISSFVKNLRILCLGSHPDYDIRQERKTNMNIRYQAALISMCGINSNEVCTVSWMDPGAFALSKAASYAYENDRDPFQMMGGEHRFDAIALPGAFSGASDMCEKEIALTWSGCKKFEDGIYGISWDENDWTVEEFLTKTEAFCLAI